MVAGPHYEDQDGDHEGGDGGEGDPPLSRPQLLPLRHGAAQEEIEAGRRGANQAEQSQLVFSYDQELIVT